MSKQTLSEAVEALQGGMNVPVPYKRRGLSVIRWNKPE